MKILPHCFVPGCSHFEAEIALLGIQSNETIKVYNEMGDLQKSTDYNIVSNRIK